MTGPYPAIPLALAAMGLGLCARSGVRSVAAPSGRSLAGWVAYAVTAVAVLGFYAITAP